MRRVFDVYSSIFQAHRGFINGEPFTSDSYERTYEHSYQPKYESNVSCIGTISSTTDQFIISNENSLEITSAGLFSAREHALTFRERALDSFNAKNTIRARKFHA